MSIIRSQINPLVSAQTVHHSSTYIIFYMYNHKKNHNHNFGTLCMSGLVGSAFQNFQILLPIEPRHPVYAYVVMLVLMSWGTFS